MEHVRIAVEIVRDIVLVELHAGQVSSRVFQLVYDDVFDRLDQLIDAGTARWIKARQDHFVIMPQRDVSSIELEVERKKQLRL
jgi:hypothetical protein